MKAKYLWVAALFILVFIGCDDTTGTLGMGVLPESDIITVDTISFSVRTESTTPPKDDEGRDRGVYAKTVKGYVGRFTDTENGFGYYEGSFLTELNCIDDLEFPKPYDAVTNRTQLNMAGDLEEAFVGARVNLEYYDFFGDSMNLMKIGIYELEEKLEKNHYTNIDPSLYTNPSRFLGSKTFTAIDQSDDSQNASSSNPFSITIPIPDHIGKNIIQQNWDHPEYFEESKTFIDNVFKGLHVKNEVGDGTVLYINQAHLQVLFNSFVVDSVGDIIQKTDESGDSLRVYHRYFSSTMEVNQANEIKISDEVKQKAEEKEHTYLKSPAGIWTRGILPIAEFARKLDLEKDTINAVKLTFTGYHHEATNQFSMSAPKTVLLIREKEVTEFFEDNKIPNNTTSYVTSINSNEYTFTNITRLITSCIKEMEEDKKEKEDKGETWDEQAWLEENAIVIIPVTVNTDSSSGSITNVQHDLTPAFIRLKGGDPASGGSLLNLQVVYTTFNQ